MAACHVCCTLTWRCWVAATEPLDAPVLWLYAYDKEYWLVWLRQPMVLVPPAEVDVSAERLPRQEAELYLLMPNGEFSESHKLKSSCLAAF